MILILIWVMVMMRPHSFHHSVMGTPMQLHKNIIMIAIASSLAACGSSSTKAPEFDQASYSFSTDEDVAVSGSVSATSNKSLTYTLTGSASNGTLALESDGSFTYTPSDDFNGSDSATIQASDGKKTASTTVTITVNAVNDAPVIVTDAIQVKSSAETSFTLSATDVDGDTITFALVSAPESGTITLNEDGTGSYTAETLEEITGSFTVSYTDGVISTPIEAEISLQAAVGTSEDKSAYYYSSSLSHLKKAEALRDKLNDDEAENEVNTELAAGYYVAGLDSTAESFIDSITTLDEQARAYRAAGVSLDTLGRSDEASDLRLLSQTRYNQYIAEKGLDNIAKDDATFFLTLIRNYTDAGQYNEAQQLLTVLVTYALSAKEDEYTSTYGSFLTAFRDYAENDVENYLADPTETNLASAIDAIENYASLVLETAPYLQRSGTYEGEPTDRIKALYIFWAAELAFTINDIELAKEYLAEVFASYCVVGYDEENVTDISEYCEVTREVYTYPMSLAAGLYEYLYPESTENPALAVLDEYGTSTYINRGYAATYAGRIVNAVKAGAAVAEAVTEAYTYFEGEGDYHGLYQALTEYRPTQPRAATVLYREGYTSEAIELLNLANDVLLSPEHYDDTSSVTNNTGWLGCYRLTELQAEFGGDVSTQLTNCKSLVDTYFTTENGATSANAIGAHFDLLMAIIDFGNDADLYAGVVTAVEAEIDALEDDAELALQYSILASLHNKAGNYDLGAVALTVSIEAASNTIAEDDVDAIADVLSNISAELTINGESNEYDGWLSMNGYLYGLRASVADVDDFATRYAEAKAEINALVSTITEKALTFSDADLQDVMEDLITVHFYLGNENTVTTLISNSVNGDADMLDFNSAVAQAYAANDAFPSSAIAFVDTDEDGMPNFFLSSATEEDIAESGLTLDDDSDNDGIPDEEDDSPLVPNE